MGMDSRHSRRALLTAIVALLAALVGLVTVVVQAAG
jgi:hypothetical protein